MIDQEADDEFARELAKMMADSGGEVRKKGGSNLFDAGIPFIKRATQQDNVVSEEETEVDGQHMRFSLLSKKGNKHRVRPFLLFNRKPICSLVVLDCTDA